MFAILRSAGWLVCVVYSTIPSFWLLIHSRAEYWRSRPYSPFVLLAPLWAAMWLVVALLTAPWRAATLYVSTWEWAPALLLFLLGTWIYRQSAASFSLKQLIGVPELRAGRAEPLLVNSGIRARVRHPVYLAHLCEMMVWSVGTGLVVCFALTAFAVATGAWMIRAEDAELERRFGETFRTYRNRVPALVPRVR